MNLSEMPAEKLLRKIYAWYGYIGRHQDNRYSTEHLTRDGIHTLCSMRIMGSWRDWPVNRSKDKVCKRCQKFEQPIGT